MTGSDESGKAAVGKIVHRLRGAKKAKAARNGDTLMLRSILIAALLAASLLAAACLAVPAAVHADGLGHCWDLGGCPQRRRARRHRKPKPDVSYYAPPKWDELAEDDGNKRPVCATDTIEVISTEHTNEENAREAGRKMLMAAIQWRIGGAYMDLSLAEEFREHCGPSNAMDTMSSRISEATNKLIGQEGQNVRCIMRARPCRARLEKVEGHR